jgi:hypothetical protein
MRITRLIMVAVLSSLLLVSASSIGAQGDAPMDHAAMAASYDAEAKAAQQKVASHELMLSRYESMPMLPKGSGATKEQMVKHCQKLVDSYKEAATQASDLAKEHRAMAQAAQ